MPQFARAQGLAYGDVRKCFLLQVPLALVGGIVVPQRAVNIDRVRIVPLDQVAVVDVHGPYQVRHGGAGHRMQRLGERGRSADQFHRHGFQLPARVIREQWFHGSRIRIKADWLSHSWSLTPIPGEHQR